ncbi:hypothetical protein LQZ19_15320 [Treponema primitia]|uniref:hypothetical protein n=1 Tax=Treponema primitia TaxID=88058 RepID=UPI00398168A0
MELRKLTEEEKQKVITVVKALLFEELPEEPTEYDVLMKQKREEYIQSLLKDNEPSQINDLLEMCERYLDDAKNETMAGFGLIVGYDMWLNKSAVWPVNHNPEWEEWNKLKSKKVMPGKKI